MQHALERHVSEGLLRLKEKLKKEREKVLLQEELLWRHKSRVEWLKAGDKNTMFFHLSTVIRRRRNKVEELLNEHGDG